MTEKLTRPVPASAQRPSSAGSTLRASDSSITGMPSRTGHARASARQTSSPAALRNSSEPLQIGQTRMSNRRWSMRSFLHEIPLRCNTVHQGSVDTGLQRDDPEARVLAQRRDALAFYGVLFSDQHDIRLQTRRSEEHTSEL